MNFGPMGRPWLSTGCHLFPTLSRYLEKKKSLTLKQPCFEVVSCSGVNLLNRGAKSV